MILTYEHCGVKWRCSENHFKGDVCFNCGTNAMPIQPKMVESENEEEAYVDDIP
jgi:hypothetical protein